MALGLAAWLGAVASDGAVALVLVLGAAGAVLTGGALAWPAMLGPALATSAAAYAALLALDEPALDARAAGVAAALAVTGELVGWSRELATTSVDEPGGTWRRPAFIAAIGLGTLFLGSALLAVVDLARVSGLAVEAVGVLAAITVVALVLRAATERQVSD